MPSMAGAVSSRRFPHARQEPWGSVSMHAVRISSNSPETARERTIKDLPVPPFCASTAITFTVFAPCHCESPLAGQYAVGQGGDGLKPICHEAAGGYPADQLSSAFDGMVEEAEERLGV